MRLMLTRLVRLLLRLFFSRVEVEGIEKVPAEPAILVLNHPNGLVDPMVVLALAPRPVSFLAKSTLFAVPLLGACMRALDCLPVYRQQDAGADPRRNRETFALAGDILQRGGTIALFPEGTTHSRPHLLPLKTGAARIALGTVAQAPQVPLWMVPAWLYYTHKGIFRSKVLLVFGEPLRVHLPVTSEEGHEPSREQVLELSSQIERAIAAVALQASEQRILDEVAIAQQLFTTTEAPSVHHEFVMRRAFVEGYQRLAQQDPVRLAAFEDRLLRFEAELRAAGLSYVDVVARGGARQSLVRLALGAVVEMALLLPPALVGFLVHAPLYELVGMLARRTAGRDDTVLSTFKLGYSVVLFPLQWGCMAWWAGAYLGTAWGFAAVPLAWVGALAALRLQERAERGSRGGRALLCFLTQRGEYARLVAERSALCEEFARLGVEMGLVEPPAA